MKLIIATRNEKKLSEIKSILCDVEIEVCTLQEYPDTPEIEEDGNTFDENALKKARVVAEYTGEWALADDSGLEVAVLNGRPGVFSSRFAHECASDDENNRKLLKELKGVPYQKRSASFVCSIAIVRKGWKSYVVQGRCNGFMSETMRGSKGFGYDPLFIVPEYNKTFAELGPEVKNTISHRTQALNEAKQIIKKIASPQRST